jgi:general L-amino acid transport system permease protein
MKQAQVDTVRGRPAPALRRPRNWKSLWRSRRARGILYQLAAVALLLLLVVFMSGNAAQSLASRGMQLGLGFLSSEAGFTLAESVIPFSGDSSFLRAFLAGLANTLWISFVSVILATILGVLLGMARLSSNWLVSHLSTAYVELFRNTPQLIQIVFWYTLSTLLPGARQAWGIDGVVFLSNRGLTMAWPADQTAFSIMWVALLVGLLAIYVFSKWADRHRQRTGRPLPVAAMCLIGLAVILLATWFMLGRPTEIDSPRLGGFNFRGGITLSPEFLSLSLGLVLYFAAYISEIVRSGIQSVSRGQIEAGRAVGLRGGALYRRIILPQALRVIVPPVTAQYISLVKTSALGVAVGYPELFNVTNSIISISGHTLECVMIMGMMYLLLALTIAGLMNLFNRSVALRGSVRR